MEEEKEEKRRRMKERRRKKKRVRKQEGIRRKMRTESTAPRGVLRFGLVGRVPPAAWNPYPCSGVIFPKKVSMFRDFSEKRYAISGIFSKFSGVGIATLGKF